MAIKKTADWASWRSGLRTASLKAGASQLVLSLGSLMGTNGVAQLKIPGLADIGMGWKTFLGQLIIGFIIHTVYAAAKYVMDNPEVPVIEETFDTTAIAKDGTKVDTSVTLTHPAIPTTETPPTP